MSADDTTICPPKRPRQPPDGDNSPSSSSSVIVLANLERHPEFWGNIVLVTPKHMGFCVFRGLLAAQSTVFADVFASSCVSANERLDGCPVVQVTDSHHDLVHLFRVLLPTSPIKYHTEPDPDYVRSFDELSAVIRLSHKYHISSIQEQALRALQAYVFTSDFDTYFGPPKGHVSAYSIQPIGAVNIARLTDTPLMLPTALYACCQMGGGLLDGWTREDGTVEHLATDDAKRCFDAYVTLAREQALVPSCLFAAVPPNRCTERGRCSPSITALASNVGLVEAMMQEDVLTDRSALIRAVRPRSVCEGCTQVLLERDRSRRERLWDRLPQTFGIAVEGWVKPSGSEGMQS